MKKKLQIMLLMLCCALHAMQARQTAAEKMGWKIAAQSYTFNRFTLMEAMDKCADLGIKYIEVYPGHRLGGKWDKQTFGLQLDKQSRQELMDIAKKKGVRFVGTGVWGGSDPKEWEKIFQLAKDMDMEYITCEPPLSMWPHLDKLVQQYGISIAVHNHPQPSTYWQPQPLLDAVRGLDSRMGACADVGHWSRSGLDQLECLRQTGDRIMSLHFKDILPEGAKDRHDVIWGTGSLQVSEMLRILNDLNFQGYFAIEYEYNWMNSVPEIRKSIQYFNSVVEEIAKEEQKK